MKEATTGKLQTTKTLQGLQYNRILCKCFFLKLKYNVSLSYSNKMQSLPYAFINVFATNHQKSPKQNCYDISKKNLLLKIIQSSPNIKFEFSLVHISKFLEFPFRTQHIAPVILNLQCWLKHHIYSKTVYFCMDFGLEMNQDRLAKIF